jgi:putative spermidine/putrescine transport system ATP-binding protein
MSAIRIEKLNKSYNRQPVLRDITFRIEEGELVTLLGPSGCGKSTLLRSIAGLADIDSGSIYIGDRDIVPLPPRKREIGMVFQSYALFPNLTVFENIAFGLRMERMKKAALTPLVEEMIALIELTGKENRYPAELSGGQQQRVALARALVKKPKVLLLDEPLGALDAQIRRTLREELVRIQKRLKMTTVFVTHDQEEALAVSDRIVVMNAGRIEQQGPPAAIYADPANEFVLRFIGSYNIWTRTELQRAGIGPLPAGSGFAIRPEAIRLAQDVRPGELTARGSIERMTMLGSIVRFQVNVGGVSLLVDRLNERDVLGVAPGAQVTLAFPAAELRVIDAAALPAHDGDLVQAVG